MKVIIAGTRTFSQYSSLLLAVDQAGFKITEVVSGGARGADHRGEYWAAFNNIPVKLFPAKWHDLEAPNARIKQGPRGPYNARAGFDRNTEMVKYADALIALWDEESFGTRHMIASMQVLKKPTFVYNYLTNQEVKGTILL